MKTRSCCQLVLWGFVSCLLCHGGGDCRGTEPEQVLWYAQPAQQWASEALPIGNGRLGAMLFGGVTRDRIQFNESSLWSGDNNWDGDYNCGDHGFGSYRNFGDLHVTQESPDSPDNLCLVTSPSGHENGNGNSIANSYDGRADSKWCIEKPGNEVLWQVELPAPRAVSAYTFTSADDVPVRDPRNWVFEGSQDARTWKELDSQHLEKPFEKRHQSQTFKLSASAAYRFYRFTFDTKGYEHFQVGEIALGGVHLVEANATSSVPADYRRELDIGTGIHRTRYTRNGVTFTREAFASRPDQVLVLHYSASQPGALFGKVSVQPGQLKTEVQVDSQGLSWDGVMPNQLRHACRVRVIPKGGTARVEANGVRYEKCDELTLLLAAHTDYLADYKANWRGKPPAPIVADEVASAAKKSLDQLRSAHLADLASLLGRVKVAWGTTEAAIRALPTDVRLAKYRQGGNDSDLEATMFQYGRYLLASCSRPGGLPANLQGLWNDSNTPAWASDYHNNINVQMNYWGAETTALSECHQPLLDFVVAALEPCRRATRRSIGPKMRGWTARTSQNIFGGNGWEWNKPASAWYAHHFAEHYAFTQDRDFLKNQGYPVVKEVCEFWEDYLKRLPDGTLVAPSGWSPEHGPYEDGCMHDQQIVWDLFQNYLEMAKALGVDAQYQTKVADMQAHLAPNKIGKWGQLQEWQIDRDGPNDHHRHISHLFAVYPGRQIDLTRTPDLARAAIKSLRARSNDLEDSGKPFTVDSTEGDSRRSWTWPWRCAVWARLGDGQRAGIMVRGLLTHNTMSNLFCNHPPFQMDGNFGIVGAIPEMLLQSHTGTIVLLPALPSSWKDGSFTGLRARGGFVVDAQWKDAKLVECRIKSLVGNPCKLSYAGKTIDFTTGKDNTYVFDGALNENRASGSPGGHTYTVDPAKGEDSGKINAIKLAPGDQVVIMPGVHHETLALSAIGTKEKPVVVRFAPGRHEFRADHALRQVYFISNCLDSTLPIPYGIVLKNCRFVQMIGEPKSEIVYGDRMTMVINDHSEDITYSGLTFDYKRPTVSEVRVLDTDENHVTVQVAEGSTYAIDNGKFAWTGDLGTGEEMSQEAILETGKCRRGGAGKDLFKEANAKDLGGGKILLTYPDGVKNKDIAKGRQYHYRYITRTINGFVNTRCKNIALLHCTFYCLPGMGVVSQFTENITMQRVDVVPRPGTIRTCPAWADCFHFSGCRGDILVESCNFSGMQDDAINVHGTYLRLMEKTGPNLVLVRFGHSQTYGFAAFQPGDRVEFVDYRTLRHYAPNTVTGVERKDDWAWLLTLAEPVADFGKNDVIDNVTWYPNLTVRNCTVTLDPVRGFLITTRGKVLVEGCTLTRTEMEAIRIADDARGWFESGPVRDVTIRNNKFIACGNITVNPEIDKADPALPVHENVRILDNNFEGGGIFARSVKGLIVKGNRFTEPVPFHHEACTDVTVEDNRH